MDAVVRRASIADLPSILAINEHYVLQTVNTFAIRKPSLEAIKSKFEATQQRHLPYLVAVDPTGHKVLGYAYAFDFRGSLGYGQCVEISIFCDPANTSVGVGSKLMERLLNELRSTKHVTWEHRHEDDPMEFEIKKAIAIIAVDERAPLNLARWYIDKFGFKQVGCLKGVGSKQGRT
jgi:L-amino acid N-acyltransferase YncA